VVDARVIPSDVIAKDNEDVRLVRLGECWIQSNGQAHYEKGKYDNYAFCFHGFTSLILVVAVS
jgi:hypothetical protein